MDKGKAYAVKMTDSGHYTVYEAKHPLTYIADEIKKRMRKKNLRSGFHDLPVTLEWVGVCTITGGTADHPLTTKPVPLSTAEFTELTKMLESPEQG